MLSEDVEIKVVKARETVEHALKENELSMG